MIRPLLESNGNYIHPTCLIGENVDIGKNNHFGPYCVIGFPAEHKSYPNTVYGKVKIGNNNIFTGLVTIDAGTEGTTEIGNGCYFMKSAHAGHDAVIGDNITVSCGAKIGGHSKIGNRVTIGLNAVIHQWCLIPEGCMIGALAFIGKKTELEKFRKYAGVPAKDIGENICR